MDILRGAPIGADVQNTGLQSSGLQPSETEEALRAMALFNGKKQKLTDWRSLAAGLTNAAAYGGDFEPTIITSVGGYDAEPPLAAGFNIIPTLELASKLKTLGYSPRVIVASAYSYAIACNNFDSAATQDNWNRTSEVYQAIVDEFYPDVKQSVMLEPLRPQAVEEYPDFIVESAQAVNVRSGSLQATSEKYGADSEGYLSYMLSHLQAFRDYQATPENRFVIKVGAQSEERFSKWQKAVIENCLKKAVADGFVPNSVDIDESYYGQISFYYPRLGSRPPYYPQAPDEPSLSEPIKNVGEFRNLLDRQQPEVEDRYLRLEKALGLTAVSLAGYLALTGGTT